MRRSRLAIEQELRQRIVAGTYPPGSRLPLRRDLLQEFGASPLTLQRAMDRLIEQGFLHVRRAHGTYVAERLPSRGTIALVIPGDTGELPRNRFWSALQRSAETWDPASGISFRTYVVPEQHLDLPVHRRLCTDLADGGLAGIFFVSSPYWLVDSPVLSAAVPRVGIASADPASARRLRTSLIRSGGDGELAMLQRFREDGRRRVAFLVNSPHATCPWLAHLAALGLKTRPEWWIRLSSNAVESAQPIARLLGAWPAGHGPDCLLIGDDNLVPHATAGLLDAGVAAPRDLLVAAHANFPHPTLSAVPCLRFGTDVVAILHAGLAELARLAAGGSPTIVTVE